MSRFGNLRVPGVLFVLLLQAVTCFASTAEEEKHIQVALRMIGHELLLSTGDSTSRILPIQKENNAYRIRFEKELSFDPDDLIQLANETLRKAKISRGYIVSVLSCSTQDVVYTYKVGKFTEDDMVPCNQRTLPLGCYELSITLFQDTFPSFEEKHRESNFVLIALWVTIGAIVLFAVWRRKRKSKEQQEDHVVQIGGFRFDHRKSELVFNNERVELTGKEVALLELLFESVNNTVKREDILLKVWGDEGDYVGRTLDVFISKLRKKLEADASIKIMNIRGVGYKLVVE